MTTSDKILKQYEQVRRSGEVNMFSKLEVRRVAKRMGFNELVEKINDDEYFQILDDYDSDRVEELMQ